MKNSVGSGKNYINFNTNQEKKAKTPGKPRILIVPLDWGLGHASRCIPLIRELIKQNCEIWLAGEGSVEAVLREEFPQLPFLQLTGYHIRYARTGKGFLTAMIRQFPKMISAVRHEHQWLRNLLKEKSFDVIISDNRFGLYNRSVHTVFITHQLSIKSFRGAWNEKVLRSLNYRYINRFSECWVPDNEGHSNLAGDLSHPAVMPSIPVHYLGPVSRFERLPVEETKRHLVIILSGPEPQRSIFENILIDQLVHYNGTADFIRGLPSSSTILPSTNQLRFFNHLAAAELNQKISRAEWVISRTGYSTVMDLVQLQKKGILVPTPGQPEQEYLARHLMQNRIAFCVSQEEFLLPRELEAAQNFRYAMTVCADGKLKEIAGNLVSKLG